MKFPAPVLLLGCSLVSCVTPGTGTGNDVTMEDPRKTAAINAAGDLVLKEIPALPEGREVKAREPRFRSRTLALADGQWTVNFEAGSIVIEAPGPHVSVLPMSWYPEEGGADGAFCSARVSGSTTWILLNGSSDFYDEVTRIRFSGPIMKEVIKHRVPGAMNGAVPAEERIKSQVF